MWHVFLCPRGQGGGSSDDLMSVFASVRPLFHVIEILRSADLAAVVILRERWSSINGSDMYVVVLLFSGWCADEVCKVLSAGCD